MREKLNILFRAGHIDDPPERGNRNRKRPADALEHNRRNPVSIRFRITIDVGKVQNYIRELKLRIPEPLEFKYDVTYPVQVEGSSTGDNRHASDFLSTFIEYLREKNPDFKVKLVRNDSIDYKNIYRLIECRMNEITIENNEITIENNETGNLVLAMLPLVYQNPKPQLINGERLIFYVKATLTPEQTVGQSLF